MDIFDFSDGREGYYGEYGGVFLPEILQATIEELLECFRECKADPKFWQDYVALLQNYSGRPTPLTHLENLSRELGGAQIYAKRDDLNHTGSHKVNNVMGQGLLTQRLGKTRVIAETGAGQHGFATATMAARFGFDCKIYMGAVDVARQRPNVFWMENLGAEVIAVEDGQKTLKDAVNECMRDWVTNMANTHYILGTACGPHPFPEMVSWFQSIIGLEAREQILAQTGRLPDRVFACVGGGSNAMGVFYPFIDDVNVQLIGIEAGGKNEFDVGSASISDGTTGVLHGAKTKILQSDDGNILETSSISAGLDYPGVGPEHAYLDEIKRAKYVKIYDGEALDAFYKASKLEGIIPALETAHAIAYLHKLSSLDKDLNVVVNMSGRGDKDLYSVMQNDQK